MGSRFYPSLHCSVCHEPMRLIAVCEKPDAQTETRFYECSNPACRDSFSACVPILHTQGWIGLRKDAEEVLATAH